MVLGGNDFGGCLLGSTVVGWAARVSVVTVVSRAHWVQFGSSLLPARFKCSTSTDAGTSTSRVLLGGLGSVTIN
jgi:hypothetical protein